MKKAPIDVAIKEVGSLTELAKRLGSGAQVLVNWRKRGIPANRVLDVERESGVNRTVLRSDIYPAQKAA